VLFLNKEQTEALIDIDALIEVLASVMADLSAGHASAPERVGVLVPERGGLLAAMPSYVPSIGVLMSKLVSLYPHNAGTGLATHQAIIVVFDPGNGEPVALMDGAAITAMRSSVSPPARPQRLRCPSYPRNRGTGAITRSGNVPGSADSAHPDRGPRPHQG
jgi:alanine dehydrogenase